MVLDGKIGVMGAIVGQFIGELKTILLFFNTEKSIINKICIHAFEFKGGILFSLLAGQPLVVIMTTAPIAIYIKV